MNDNKQNTKTEDSPREEVECKSLLAILNPKCHLTAKKVSEKLEQGYSITGFVIESKTGQKCIVDKSAGRWLTPKEMEWLMHISSSPLC